MTNDRLPCGCSHAGDVRQWLEARLDERAWTGADLTRASQTPRRPARLRQWLDQSLAAGSPPHGAVPRSPQTLSDLALALDVPESEVYTAAGLQPRDVPTDEQVESGDVIDRTVRVRMQQFASIVGSYPRALRVAVIDANIAMAAAFKSLAAEPDNSSVLSAAADSDGPHKRSSQARHKTSKQPANERSRSASTDFNSAQTVVACAGRDLVTGGHSCCDASRDARADRRSRAQYARSRTAP